MTSRKLKRILKNSSDIEKANRLLKNRIDEIMMVENFNLSSITDNETADLALPTEERYLETGYYKLMLRRYLFASHFAKGKRVLDSCCGLGWGAYLVATEARRVIGLDRNASAISFSHSHWKAKNLDYICAHALMGCFRSASFDVVLAMETVEHFTADEMKAYLVEVSNVLNEGGLFIGSSSFPETRAQADSLCSKSPFHKYIHTEAEIKELLGERFCSVFLLERNIFLAY